MLGFCCLYPSLGLCSSRTIAAASANLFVYSLWPVVVVCSPQLNRLNTTHTTGTMPCTSSYTHAIHDFMIKEGHSITRYTDKRLNSWSKFLSLLNLLAVWNERARATLFPSSSDSPMDETKKKKKNQIQRSVSFWIRCVRVFLFPSSWRALDGGEQKASARNIAATNS